jgi:hypothetical protein
MCFWAMLDRQCSCGFGSDSRARLPDLNCELFSATTRSTPRSREERHGGKTDIWSLALPLLAGKKRSEADPEAHMLTKVVPGHDTF